MFWASDRAGWKRPLLLAGLVLAAYAPAFNNGFIADDFVILRRIEELRANPFLLFSIPPEMFRFTSYACFLLLKTCFGYHAQFFYGFTILLHLLNTLLLRALLRRVCEGSRIPDTCALIFAVTQNPQEAVMWLAGMNEALLGAFILAGLLLWVNGRHGWSAVCYAAALISKESAVILPAMILLLERIRFRNSRLRKEHLCWIVPSLAFAAAYFHLASRNPLLTTHLYAVTPRSAWVWIHSIHRLLFPWAYLLLMVQLKMRAWPALRRSLTAAGWLGLALLPYVFLTYQSHVPSRNQYVAAMGLAWLLAAWVDEIPAIRIRYFCLSAYIVWNVGYLWMVKDPQYLRRAAPTSRLLEEFRSRNPGRLLLLDFPGNPWIARETTLLAPAWNRDLIVVGEPAGACPECAVLRWDEKSGRYQHPAPAIPQARPPAEGGAQGKEKRGGTP